MLTIIHRLCSLAGVLTLIACILLFEILLRLSGNNSFTLSRPHFWETNFTYDRELGHFSKPNYVVDLSSHGFPDIVFDHRGFPLLPAIQHDKTPNDRKILFVGRCDTYGGPMVPQDKAFMNLLARETSQTYDFDVIGVSGYSLYQEYLLYKRYPDKNNTLVIMSFCPALDFNLNSRYYFYTLSNRRVPRPQVINGTVQHEPVPYVQSYWDYTLPVLERLSAAEHILNNSYLLAKIINWCQERNSFDIALTKKIILSMQADVKSHGGRLALFFINWLPDSPDPKQSQTADEFTYWLKNNDIGVIDVRNDLIGFSLAKAGDPTHVNHEGQVIIKNKIAEYLKQESVINEKKQ